MKKRFSWKCRCMGNGNEHDGGAWLMSGTWKVHMSFIQSISPCGLHRIVYRLKNNDLDNLFSDDGWIKVVYRNSNKVHRLRKG